MTITWLPEATDFVEDVGLDPEIVLAVVQNPLRTERDPRSNLVGYEIKRLRRGDIEAVVGYLDPANPAIMFVRLLDSRGGRPTGKSTKGGTGRAGDGPSNVTDLVKRAQEMGYTTEYSTHIKLMWKGSFAMAVPRTPSDYRSLTNVWHQLVRDHKTRMEESNGEAGS